MAPAKPAPMQKGEVYALELGAVYQPTATALRDKYIVAWCYGRGGTMGSGAPLFRFAVGDAASPGARSRPS